MADRYIDRLYVEQELGADFVAAASGPDGVVLDRKIERATALAQGWMRAAGYETVSTTDPADVEEAVKLAVLGLTWRLLASSPEVSCPLPSDWDDHPAHVAYDDLRARRLQLAATPTNISARGGWAFSSKTAYPQRSSRSELKGY